MKTKICTSIEQSKKLLELGLDAESADCVYLVGGKGPYISQSWKEKYRTGLFDLQYIPCWSLATLFAILPNKIVSHETAFEGEDVEGINDIYHKCIEPTEDERYMCCYLGNGCKYKCVADNPVDACVAMIECLNESNLL